MKKFTLRVKELKRKSDGAPFNVYKIELKSGKTVDCKFRKSCPVIPQNDCIIHVEDDQYNLDKSGRFWCYWVYEIAKIEKMPDTPQTDIEL